MDNSGEQCKCPCHKAIGVLVVAFGLTFLLGALNVLSPRVVGITWPVIIILAGLKSLCGGMCKCCSKA